MLQKVKDFLTKYKVQVTVVGGVLVVATALGTCSFDASEVSDATTEETTVAVPVSTTTGTETTGTETTGTETTGTETTGTETTGK